MLKLFKRIRSEPIAAIVLFLLSAVFCIAGFSGFDALRLTPKSTDIYTIDSRNTSGTTTFSVTPDGAGVLAGTLSATTVTLTGISGTGVVSATNIANVVRYVHLPLSNWAIETTGAGSTVGVGWTAITASTTPGWEIDDSVVNLNWATGETSPVQQTFTVPADYASGGDFLAAFTLSTADPLNSIDFDVYINTPSAAAGADTAATNQTAMVLPALTSTLSQVTLTVATDFATLAAGDSVTLRLWGGAGGSDKELKGDVLFRYTATQ